MEHIKPHHYNNERKETLHHIKEYILGLLKKKKEQQSSKEQTKKDLKDTLSSKTPQEMKDKEEKKRSLRDKLKEKISGTDSNNDTNTKQQAKIKSGGFELPPEDQDEYVPQDSEFGEALGESPRFAEVYPPYIGYYTQGKKSYFDPNTNLRSKKKQLSELDHSIGGGKKKYTYAGYIQSGTTAIPLPDESLPDTDSLRYYGSQPPIFQIDQNNCIYIISKEKQAISFQFALKESKNILGPIAEDSENIIFSSLTTKTQTLLDGLHTRSPIDQARALSYYIKTSKKYNTNKQGTLRDNANSKNYINKLDESPVLECYSANILLVALCRQLGIPARLVVGHMVQGIAKDGKAHLSNNNGHAWSEIWDGSQRVRLDATPTIKENGESSDQNMEDQEQSSQSSDGNMDDGADSQDSPQDSQQKNSQSGNNSESQQGSDGDKESKEGEETEGETNKEKTQKNGEMTGPRKQKLQPPKSAEQMLDEFIKKAKEDNLTAQGEQLNQALEQLERSESKEDIRKILDEAGLSDFAKEELDKIGNQGILEEEKKEIESIEDEHELEQKLSESLLDPEYKNKLKEYADTIRQRIEEQKKKMKSEMERFGFSEQELGLYKQYKTLEKEVMPEVRKQINELQRILPPQYIVHHDEDNYYRSGARLDRSKLTDWAINGNNKIFQRSKIEQDVQQINMFETIIIDRSGSMGSRSDEKSPFSQSVKAAITRAKVLEHFKVDMSIVIFDDSIDEVMNFGENFGDHRTKIPSKLMRAYTARSGGNSQEPITHIYHKMKDRMRQLGGTSFGNISFIGDGDLYSFQQLPPLKAMINDLKKQGMGVTAYYINQDETKMPLIEYYFGSPEDGHALYAKDSHDLSTKIITNHKSKLNLLIKKYIKTQP